MATLHQRFADAGFAREARTLSTTENGRIIPGLGHYIAIIEDGHNLGKNAELYALAGDKIYDFMNKNKVTLEGGTIPF